MENVGRIILSRQMVDSNDLGSNGSMDTVEREHMMMFAKLDGMRDSRAISNSLHQKL
jgi:hypothetical protein